MSGIRYRGLVVQDRDRRLLSELSVMRIIDREQAKVVAGFHSTTRANTRLLGLTRAGLLRRFFVGTITSGRKAIYSLSPRGAALVDMRLRPVHRKQDETFVGDLFIEHQQRINHAYLAVKYQVIPAATFRQWLVFDKPISQAAKVVPDAYLELDSPQGIRAMFLEVDLGTESLRIIKQKIQSYLQLAVSGEFQKLFGPAQFRVLFLTSSERRLRGIRQTALRRTDRIFWFSTFEIINRDGFWSASWLRPKGDQKLSLL